MLSKHPDVCKFPHGHSRKVELILEADTLDENDMVCDFKVLRETMHDFLQTWDHALCVNTKDKRFKELKGAYGDRVVGFEGVDPTTEIMAQRVFLALRKNLLDYTNRGDAHYRARKAIRISRVRVWETHSSWAEYVE